MNEKNLLFDEGKKTLVQISRYAGMREDLVQAGGGNTSVKISDDLMIIKASGYQLADITTEKGFAMVNYRIIKDFFYNKNLDSIVKEDEYNLLTESFIEGEKPSIETFLHAITGKVTLHTHSVLANVLTVRKNGMDELKNLFPDALFVNYATPGIELAREYFKEFKNKDREVKLVFLKNHGIIVSGDTYAEVRQHMEETTAQISNMLSINYEKYTNVSWLYDMLCTAGIKDILVYLVNHKSVYEAYEAYRNQIWEINFCPDVVVFCGKKILTLRKNSLLEDIREYMECYGVPSVLIYQGYFYIVTNSIKKAKEIESLLAFSAEVMLNNRDEEIDFLSSEEQDFLLNWDAEKYRKNMK